MDPWVDDCGGTRKEKTKQYNTSVKYILSAYMTRFLTITRKTSIHNHHSSESHLKKRRGGDLNRQIIQRHKGYSRNGTFSILYICDLKEASHFVPPGARKYWARGNIVIAGKRKAGAAG